VPTCGVVNMLAMGYDLRAELINITKSVK